MSNYSDPNRETPIGSPHGQVGPVFDPANPNHVKINFALLRKELNLAEYESLVRECEGYLQKRERESPAQSKSAAHAELVARATAWLNKEAKGLTGSALEAKKQQTRDFFNQRTKQILREINQQIKEYNRETEITHTDFIQRLHEWRQSHNQALEFLRAIRSNSVIFDAYKRPSTEARKVVKGLVRQAKAMGLLRGSWRWTVEGKQLLKSIGFNKPTEPARDLEGGVKRSLEDFLNQKNPRLNTHEQVQKQLAQNLADSKARVHRLEKSMVRLERDIQDQMKKLYGRSINDKSQEAKLIAGNKKLKELVANYEEVRRMHDQCLDAVTTAQGEQEEIGLLLSPLVEDAEAKAQLLKEAYENVKEKYQKWSALPAPEEAVPLRSGKYADLPCRDIPIDHLLWIEHGAYIDAAMVREFEHNGKKLRLDMPISLKSRRPIGYASFTHRIVHEYLASQHGKERLREHYGTALPDFIRVVDRHLSDQMMEKSVKVQKELADVFNNGKSTKTPEDRKRLRQILKRIRQEAHESYAAVTKWEQFKLYFTRYREQGYSPEQAKRQAQRALDEGSEENKRGELLSQSFRVPTAFNEVNLTSQDKEAIEYEDYLHERDKLRRLFYSRLSHEAIIQLLWPPKSPSGKYTPAELRDNEKRYYTLRARVLQTDPLDREIAGTNKGEGGSQHVPTGWRAALESWRRDMPAGAWYVALAVEEQIEQLNDRSQLQAYQQRLVELFHQTIESMLTEAAAAGELSLVEAFHETQGLSYLESFAEDPENEYIKHLHNKIQERINIYAHPDVSPTQPEKITDFEANRNTELPYPELVSPEQEASREEFDRKQEEESTTFPRQYPPLSTLKQTRVKSELSAEDRAAMSPFQALPEEQPQFHTDISPFDANEYATESDIQSLRKGRLFF